MTSIVLTFCLDLRIGNLLVEESRVVKHLCLSSLFLWDIVIANRDLILLFVQHCVFVNRLKTWCRIRQPKSHANSHYLIIVACSVRTRFCN